MQMALQGLILALFFIGTLIPYGWNKFDNPTKATFVYIFGGVLVFLVITGWKRMRKMEMTKKMTKQVVIISALAVLAWAAWITSPVSNFGLSEVAVFIGGMGVCLMAQMWNEKEKKYGIYFLLTIGFISVMLGCFQYLVRTESRIAGPFFELISKAHYFPNAFALFLLMIWPLALTLEKKWIRVVLLAGFFTGISLTFSRAAWITAAIQIICLGVYKICVKKKNDEQNKKINVQMWLTTVFTILLTIVFVLGMQGARSVLRPTQTNSFAQKAVFAGTEKETSVFERAQFMTGTIKLIQNHPWLGSGPFSFRYIYPAIQTDFLAVSDHPHNWYLKIALEEGLPAAILFMTLLLWIIVPAIRSIVKNSTKQNFTTQNIFTLPILLAILGALLHSAVDYNMNFFATQLLFWLLLGWLAGEAFTGETQTIATTFTQKQNHKKLWPHLVILLFVVLPVSIILIREGALAYTRTNREELLFPRTWFLDETYRILASRAPEALNPESQQWKLAYANIKEAIKRNPYDAQAINLEGHFFQSAKKYQPLALETFANAVTLDPANVFGYYIDYIALAQQDGKTDTKTYISIAKKAVTFLLNYPEKVEKNIHYTAQSGNLKQAVILSRLLNRNDITEKILTAASKYTSKL